MTQNLNLGNIGTSQKVSVSNQINSSNLNYSNIKSDSCTLDMDQFNTIPNSRITGLPDSIVSQIQEPPRSSNFSQIQRGQLNLDLNGTQFFKFYKRNHSRKGSQRGGEKKMNSTAEKERDGSILVPKSSSPRAALVGSSTLEKPIVVTVGATTSHSINHQITITTPATTAAASTTTGSKLWGKRYGFKCSSSFWTIDPRRILFFFATLSSMGTILLIYFTLSAGKCLKLE